MTMEGALTALVTPFRDGDIDYDAVTSLIDEQIEAGIDGVVVCGTTGESPTLSFREKVQLAKHAVHVASDRVPIIAGAGTNCTRSAIELTRACEEAGVQGLLHVVPYYNKPPQEGLYRHFHAISESTALPIMLYNVPGRTAGDLLPTTVARLAELDNVVAIKEATGDIHRTQAIVAAAGDRIRVLSGDDFTALALYAVGSRGVVSVVSNIVPKRVADTWQAVCKGDFATARQLHESTLPLLDLLFQETNPIPLKAALTLMHRIKPDIREPLCQCSSALKAKLMQQLDSEGLL